MSAATAIRSTRRLGSCPRTRAGQWAIVGQDGGQTIDLGDRTLIVYSDTLLMVTGPPTPPRSEPPVPVVSAEAFAGPGLFVSNCAAMLEGPDLPAGLASLKFFLCADGFPLEILQPTEQERAGRLRLWPGHGLRVGDDVLLYYLGVTALDPQDQWAFRNEGVGIARMDLTTGRCERLRAGGDWRLWPAGTEDLHFGVQVLMENDHAYVFGSIRHGFDVSGFVARVLADEIADPLAYEYYAPARGRWLRERAAAGSIGPCGSDFSVSHNAYLDRYLMIYADSFSKRLAVRFAERPEGPFSEPEYAGRLPHAHGSELVYLALEHPRFAREHGRRVLVTYCEPHFRMPSLVEVRLG